MAFETNVVSANAPRSNSRSLVGAADRPKAQVWANIGFMAKIAGKDSAGNDITEERFIALPLGIPVDNQDQVATSSSNPVTAQQRVLQNALLGKLTDKGLKLNSGEDTIVENLVIQLRRVNDETDVREISDDLLAQMPEI